MTPTSNDTAPSVSSARWSGHGSRRRLSTRCSGDWNPLRVDDLASGLGVQYPGDERRGCSGGLAFGHLVEARHARILAGDGIRLVAGDAAEPDRVDAAFVGLVVGQ